MRWIFSFGVIAILVFAGAYFYIGLSLFGFFSRLFPDIKAVKFYLPFALICCFFTFVNFLPHNLSFSGYAGSLWMAIILYLLIPLAASDIVRLVLFLAGKKLASFSFYAVAASLLICASLSVYGLIHARSIKTVNYSLTLKESSSEAGTPLRVVLVSDTHIGSVVGKKHIERIVAKINANKPDIVCIAGDVFNGNPDSTDDIQGVIAALRAIASPVYACLGNHDVDRMSFSGGGTARIEEILREAGITLLLDETLEIRDKLYLAGRKDARPIGAGGTRKTAAGMFSNLEGTIIALDHQPVDFPSLERAGVDLVFSGHTHNGQLFPANLITYFIFKKAGAVSYGYWRGQTTQAVVTSGAGFWGPPMRVGTNSEIAVIDIKFGRD